MSRPARKLNPTSNRNRSQENPSFVALYLDVAYVASISAGVYNSYCYRYKVPTSKDFIYTRALFNLFRDEMDYRNLRKIV